MAKVKTMRCSDDDEPAMHEALDRKRARVRIVRVEGGQAIVGSVQGGATPLPPPPLAIAQDQVATTVDSHQPRELGLRGWYDNKFGAEPHA
jgi:hypothetical protein